MCIRKEALVLGDEEDKIAYKVVVNHEEQYSIWPADRENPPGWQDVGNSGLKPECLSIHQRSLDGYAPLSLRKRMEELAKQVILNYASTSGARSAIPLSIRTTFQGDVIRKNIAERII